MAVVALTSMGRHSTYPDSCYEIIDGRIHHHRVIGPAGPGLYTAKCSRVGVADPYELDNAPVIDCTFCYPPLSSRVMMLGVRCVRPEQRTNPCAAALSCSAQ